MIDLLFTPFVEYGFMRRALVACLLLALITGPIGVLLLLRRMSLVGDAMSHALLPGAAIGFMLAGANIWMMTLGGALAGLCMALLAGIVSRRTVLEEDASFAGFYLCALALGVIMLSLYGQQVDIFNLLFGSILAIDATALCFMAAVVSFVFLLLCIFYRPLILEAFDYRFFRSIAANGHRQRALYHTLFLILLVCTMVSSFQTLGTMLVLGILMLPAATARLLCKNLPTSMVMATSCGFISSFIGLLWSYHYNVPSGPAIVLSAGAMYAMALLSRIQGYK